MLVVMVDFLNVLAIIFKNMEYNPSEAVKYAKENFNLDVHGKVW